MRKLWPVIIVLLMTSSCLTIHTSLFPTTFSLLNEKGALGNYRFEKYSYPLNRYLEDGGWIKTDYPEADLYISINLEEREMQNGWLYKPVYSAVNQTTTWIHPGENRKYLVLTLTVLDGESFRKDGTRVILRERSTKMPYSGRQEDWDETYIKLLQKNTLLF